MAIGKSLVKAFNKINGRMDTSRLKKKTAFDGIAKTLDIPYAEGGNMYHMLDVYTPENMKGKLPVIIDIHGGGWIYGTKDINAHYCQGLATYGFVVVNISYRLISEGADGTFPNILQDVFAALNWVEKNIEGFGGDLNNVFLTGDSAGAHLAALTLSVMADQVLCKKLNVSTSLNFRAAGLTCGVFDLEPFAKMKNGFIKYMFKLFFGEDGAKSEYFPIMSIKNNDISKFPPLFLNTCYNDFMRKQNLAFAEILKERGLPHEFKFIDKRRVNKLWHVYSILNPEFEESVETTKAMIDFFGKYVV